MKLTIARDQFLSGLQAVQNVVGTRTTLPILSNVLLRAETGKLELTATDLDVTVSCAVPAEVAGPGATTLPAKRLFSIVRELSVGDIEVEVDDKNDCSLAVGPSFFKLRGLPAEEFPPVPAFEDQPRITLPQDKVKGMLRRTAFAVSVDEARYVLNGLFFSLKEHKLTMVATDGRRLALTDEEVEVEAEKHAEFIIPSKGLAELTRLLQDKGQVEVTFTENQAAFTLSDEKGSKVVVITKLVDGTYPNYRQVIPAECEERVPLAREEFERALRRAEIMTTEKNNSVKLAFERNRLTISANSPDIGEVAETMAVNYKGKDLAIAFNPGYLIQALKALDTEEVFLELTNEFSPGVLKINGPFLYVIMPMRMG
jgi:DNA polymerase-3 subunit beta